MAPSQGRRGAEHRTMKCCYRLLLCKQNIVTLVLTSQLLSFSALAQIAVATFSGENPQLSTSFHHPVGSSEKQADENQDIPQGGSWDALSLCIKESKEERALERWMSCVEAATTSPGRIGKDPDSIPTLEPQKRRNDASTTAYGESSLPSTLEENILPQEDFPHDGVKLRSSSTEHRFSEQKGTDSSQLPGDPRNGGLGYMKMEGLSDGLGDRVSDSAGSDPGKENGHRGSVTGGDMQSEELLLSTRNARNDGPTSDRSEVLKQNSPEFRSRGVKDDIQENAEGVNPQADFHPSEPLNSCSPGFDTSHERQVVEGENTSAESEKHPPPSLTTRGAVTSAAIVGVLTLMLKSQRGCGARKSEKVTDTSTSKSRLSASPFDNHTLSQPLGMAVAQVLYEVLEQNSNDSEGSLSAETLSDLLGSALKESLTPVLGEGRFQFVEKFRDSFSSTYRTRASVQNAYRKAGMSHTTEGGDATGRSWRSSTQVRPRREFHNEQKCVGNVESHTDGLHVAKRFRKLTHRPRTVSVKDEKTNADLLPRIAGEPTSFFSTGRLEKDGRSESSTGQYSGRKSPETLEFNPREPFAEEACSQEEQMYSADDSSGSEEWIMLKGGCSNNTEAFGQNQDTTIDGSDCCHPLESHQDPKDQTCTTIHEAVPLSEDLELSAEVESLSRMLSTIEKLIPAEPLSDLLDFYPSGDNNSPAASVKEVVELPFNGFTADSLPQVQTQTGSEDSGGSSLRTPDCRGERLFRRKSVSSSADGDGSERMTPRHAGADVAQDSGLAVQDALVVANSSNVVGFNAALDGRYDLLERSVAAQEQHNRLLAWDLQRRSQGLAMKQEHLHLQFESNTIMKENVELSRMRAEFKENELQDRKLTLAYGEFSRACADQLVAGLCVMLVALGFSFWQFSYDRLSGVVTMCRPPERETQRQGGWLGTNWMYNTLDAFTYQMQALTCEVAKAGRMIFGLVIIAFVTSSLLRRSVTSSSQAMPATIIVIVLGGICGVAGKFSIDSLGGSGFHWIILWECLCFMHAVATCFTPIVYHFLNGPPARNYFETRPLISRVSSAVARFSFHAILVLFLPLMAGLLPFASLEEIMQLFLDGTSRGRFPRGFYHHP